MEPEYTIWQTLHYHRFNIIMVLLLLIVIHKYIDLGLKIYGHFKHNCDTCDSCQWGSNDRFGWGIKNSRVGRVIVNIIRGDGKGKSGDSDG